MNKNYLRESIAEARRNETLGWTLSIVGLLALLETLYFKWLINYASPKDYLTLRTESESYYIFNLLVLLTIALMGIGIVLAGYYGGKRKRYMEKLKES